MKLLYEGKAKRIFEIEGRPDLIFHEFKDSLTALNGLKTGSFARKGQINRDIASGVFSYLSRCGVAHHWVENQGENGFVTWKLEMIPLEVVVRNKAAGSLAKKFGWSEGEKLAHPLVEFYLKSDALGDPFVSDDQAILLKAATREDLNDLRAQALLINRHLSLFFQKINLDLVDFKLEFGRTKDSHSGFHGPIVLADEVTPDTCRLWDTQSQEKLDKDRFRRDLGDVDKAYQTVCERMKSQWRGDP